MKIINYIFTMFLLNSCVTPTKYINNDGIELAEKSYVWDFVEKQVGNCPKGIKVNYWKNGNSQFDSKNNSLILGRFRQKDENLTIAHETSHLCLSAKTTGKSSQEQYRFLDEGLANIVEKKLQNKENEYRLDAGRITKTYFKRKPFGLKDMEKWSKFFGRYPRSDFNAYLIGSNFIYFLTDTYGMDLFKELISEMKNHKDIEVLFQLVSV